MLTREKFKECIKNIQTMEAFIDKLQELHIEVVEIEELFIFSYFADLLFQESFGINGADTINWWIYESEDKQLPEPDGTTSDLSTIDKLYDYVVKEYENDKRS